MKNGVIIINKEIGPTSQGVVNRVKRLLGASKAGHTGTLDPMATGVLPVLIERGVKASEFMLSSDKHYVATLLLGITTDTEDVTGETLSESDNIPTESEILEAVNSFVGSYLQTPPMYSALKVGGKKLCDLARAGVTIEREAREVTIHSLTAERISEREYTLDVHCSKGTYIRTLCADIGARLGCGGCMKTLCRASASGFSLADAHMSVSCVFHNRCDVCKVKIDKSGYIDKLGNRLNSATQNIVSDFKCVSESYIGVLDLL